MCADKKGPDKALARSDLNYLLLVPRLLNAAYVDRVTAGIERAFNADILPGEL
jgi:hypothetical protein